ncbi:LA_2444/LA_4059 family outer membrane protein [Leptospira neocaledonica]|uniref:Outer membrane protein beta-barrel domain-containing protein n=1 Tax=Leptospira neocaledonica TaxID=2023192 RepID=A0A2M9ZXW0_9LEPT|nr:LA_2444/LA_4059 family outer membrane protein [Leptospira neocaledonica]PJZ76887.1 hypothetical protein CH365_12815 [Leptospira neocaledonica]
MGLYQKYYVFILLNLFLISNSQASEEIPKTGTSEKRKQKFELLLKRQTYSFIPYNFTSYSEKTNPNESIETNHLQQNQKVLVPAVFSYENYEKNYKAEISYYEVELVNPNSNVIRSNSTGLSAERFYYSPLARSEFETNFYKIISLIQNWNLYLGGGLRNINKYTYGKYMLDGAFQEYFYTYGPQVSLQSSYQFAENFSANISLDVFYTEGTRFFKTPIISPDTLVFTNGSAGTRGIFRGFESEISLQYKFHENMRFHLGYNQISSYFSYLHFDQWNLHYNFSSPSSISISNGSRSGNYEILRGFFLGFSVFF